MRELFRKFAQITSQVVGSSWAFILAVAVIAALVLLAAPKAVGYYPKIGYTKHKSPWTINAQDPFPIRRV